MSAAGGTALRREDSQDEGVGVAGGMRQLEIIESIGDRAGRRTLEGTERRSQNGGGEGGHVATGERDRSSGGSAGSVKPGDFEWGEVVGEGSYSLVRKATRRTTGDRFAIKVVEKALVLKEGKHKYVKVEKETLNRCAHPHVVHLFCTFQDAQRLYFVMELCSMELFELLREKGTFALPCARFFAAQIVTALRFIHSKGVIHRDLKPENILLNHTGHLKITDFGTSKFVEDGKRSNSFVGTAEYVSPELLENLGAVPASDLWALGCIVFQFFCGRVPFRDGSEYLTFQKILALDYTIPPTCPAAAKDVIEKLLVIDPGKRIGAGEAGRTSGDTYQRLQEHSFFESIQWFDPPLHEQTPPPVERGVAM